MTVIKDGDPEYVYEATCTACGCIAWFTKYEVPYFDVSTAAKYESDAGNVKCPCCGKYNSVKEIKE